MGGQHNLFLGTAISTLGLWSWGASAQSPLPLFFQGLYGGVSVGAGLGAKPSLDVTPFSFLGPQLLGQVPLSSVQVDSFNTLDQSFGVLGGIQVGYNHRVDDFIAGLEIDLSMGSARKIRTELTASGTYSSIDTSASSFETTVSTTSFSTETTSTVYQTSASVSVSTATTSTSYVTSVTTFPTTTVQGTSSSTFDGTTSITTVSVIYDTTSVTTVSTSYLTSVTTFTSTITTGTSYLTSVSSSIVTLSSMVTTVATLTTARPFSVSSVGRANVDWVSTVRTRVGFVADRAFIYATGGLAIGEVTQEYTTIVNANGSISQSSFSNTQTRVGYAVGAGVEYAFTRLVSGRAQAIYYDLGSAKFTLASPWADGPVLTGKTRLDGVIVTLGLNYRFGTQ